MKSVEALAERALEYKKKGLTDSEIGDELHLSPETVTWLLSRGIREEAPPKDVKIGWRSVGVYGARLGHIANTLTDIIKEETTRRNVPCDSVLGIVINGIPLATLVSERLNVELIIYRPSAERHKGGGAFSSNYATPKGKRVVIVDDVISTGHTIRAAVEDVQEKGGKVILAVAVVNKTAHDDFDGVPVRSLIRARTLA